VEAPPIVEIRWPDHRSMPKSTPDKSAGFFRTADQIHLKAVAVLHHLQELAAVWAPRARTLVAAVENLLGAMAVGQLAVMGPGRAGPLDRFRGVSRPVVGSRFTPAVQLDFLA